MENHALPGALTTSALGTRSPSYARITLALVTGGAHADPLGRVRAGEVLRLADSAAHAVAQRHSDGPVVVAAVDEVVLRRALRVGDVLRTSGQVNWVGRTSMEVGVRVESQPQGAPSDEPVHILSAYFVLVAVDADGRPRTLPALLPESRAEVRRQREAEARRTRRLARRGRSG